MATPSRNALISFNAGELSPKLDGRVDLKKYSSGCRELNNATVESYGAAVRRPGFRYVAASKDVGKACLVDFQFSETTTFILEFGDGYVRFFSNGLQVKVAGVPYEIVSPYAEEDLFELQFAQINDVAYIAHPDFTPYKLSRLADDSWTLAAAVFDAPPLMDENLTETTLTPSATTGNITLTAFGAGDVLAASEVSTVDCTGVDPTTLGGLYFRIYDASTNFYVWFDLDGGSTDPAPGGTGLEVNVTTGDLDNDVAAAIAAVVNAHASFNATSLSGLVTITNAATGPVTDIAAGTSTLVVAVATQGVNAVSVTNLFKAGHVGSYWQLAYDRPASSVELPITGNATSTVLHVLGDWNVRTYGTWSANILVERSTDGGTNWDRIRFFAGASDRNVDAFGTQEKESAQYRITIASWSAGSGRVVLECGDAYVYGLLKITAVTDARNAEATVISELYATTATKVWREGSWSTFRGFPRGVALYEQRLYFGGTKFQALTVWGSVIGDFENFEYGTEDDAALTFTLGSPKFNAIQWLASHTRLLIGTTGDEWSISGGTGEESLTPTNVRAVRQSSYGSKAIGALLLNEVVLFVQRNGRKVREMAFSFERDGYVAPDLTLLAEHITKGGIVQLAFQQQPHPVLWAVTSEGMLIGMSYERDQEVVAWHKHPTDGLVESVAVISGTGDDEVWISVKRTIVDAGTPVLKRYIERLTYPTWTNLEDAFYVDSGVTWTGTASTTITGLAHLKGRVVSVLAGGEPIPDRQVSQTGTVTLEKAVTKAQVGLPYITTLKPMRMDMDPQIGPTQGMVRKINEVVVRFLNTIGCTYSDGKELDSLGNLKDRNILFRSTSDQMDKPPPLFSGDKRIEFMGGFEYEGDLILKQKQPLPWTVIALIVKYEVSGR